MADPLVLTSSIVELLDIVSRTLVAVRDPLGYRRLAAEGAQDLANELSSFKPLLERLRNVISGENGSQLPGSLVIPWTAIVQDCLPAVRDIQVLIERHSNPSWQSKLLSSIRKNEITVLQKKLRAHRDAVGAIF